ncbi:MAG: helix-turn-helix transcriptional regulator [Firmicutes bacterium]|nr:helix-turn-helix transcriptional regulator [Bacillota bacterium]
MIDISIRKELKAGVVELIIISLLKKRDMYGYEISNEIDNRSSNKLNVKEGTLYPILYRLEEKEVIESYWKTPKGRGKPRKYYRVTSIGDEYFYSYKEEWFVVSNIMKDILIGEGE